MGLLVWFVLVLLTTCSEVFSVSAAKNKLNDELTLVAFKDQITCDPHNILAKNWSSATSFCSWFGVICNARRQIVTALNLANLELQGQIPQLANLSFLESINLNNNSFHGHLPPQLGNLRRLKTLNLGYNNFNGEIPSTLYNCRDLQVLNLEGNKFTGDVNKEIGSLKKIMEIILGRNNLTGEIPEEIGQLVSLQRLDLDNNNLHGNIPKQIGNCTSLKELYLFSNKLTGIIPYEVGNLYNLRELNLASNQISGSIRSTFLNLSMLKSVNLASNHLSGHLPLDTGLWLPNLEELYLAQNELTGPIPDSISNSSKFRVLDISDNLFFGFIPDTLGNLRNLQKLNIANNSLTRRSSSPELSFFTSLSNCKNLAYLRIDHNPLGGTVPSSIGNLSASLQTFKANDCGFKGNIPGDFGNLSNLIGIILQNNEFIGNIPGEIGRLQYLQDFSVAHNKLHGQIPSEMCHLQKLGFLYLRENEFSGPLPSCLDNLTSIRELYLGSNRFNSTIPSSLWRITDLIHINLSLNSLSGSLPSEIGNLKVVTTIDLSNNQLSGNIPDSIGNLKDLAHLSLSGNRLQGTIPESIGDMVALEFLNLSGNNLSGAIPKSLEKLVNLKYFNVSFNRLEGEIPNAGSFTNFSRQSFIGNEALCGSSRMLVPACETSSQQPFKRHIVLYISPMIVFIVLLLAFIFLRRYYKQRPRPSIHGDLPPVATWRRVSYQELVLATNGFQETNLVGRGSFGSVYKGILSDGTRIAVKAFNLQLEGAFKSFEIECQVLRNLRHRNLVKIISSCSNLDCKALVLEFLPNYSLENWLHCHGYFLDMLQRLNIMIDVASAIEYLHHGYTMPVVHCDLKPSNVLLNEDMVAQVSDFGIAKLVGEENSIIQTMTLATIGYMAPEYGSKGIVSVKCDIYSYGILLMETFTRKRPTDEIFGGEMDLKNWVKQSLPHAVTQVADADLFIGEREHFEARRDCVASIFKLALECTADLPEMRIGIGEVLPTLKKIQLKFVTDIKQIIYRN